MHNNIKMEAQSFSPETDFCNSKPRFFFVYNPESHAFDKIPFQHFDETSSENSESQEKPLQHRITRKPNCITIELFASKAK